MKSPNLSIFNAFQSSSFFRELQKIDEIKRSWMINSRSYDLISKQLKSQNAAVTFASNISELIRSNERHQFDEIRRLLDPIDSIRNSFLNDSAFQKIRKEIESTSSQYSDIVKSVNEVNYSNTFATDLSESIQSSIVNTRKLLEDSGIVGNLSQLMTVYKVADRNWTVPSELINSLSALKGIQETYGTLTFPVIDFASATTLAKFLGPEGIAAQLTAIGIKPDGTLRENALRKEDSGIGISRKHLELMTLLSFIFTFLIPILQELSSQKWQNEIDQKLALQNVHLQAQAKQLESLSILVEKALIEESRRNEQMYVVLERTATVRSKPVNGAAVEGILLPREAVKPLAEHGKWIQFEYYHWFLQSYQTGWAMKKYFKRIPAKQQK